ncbi:MULTISPECIES: hypothetical protein [unclassified Streptomyces]
MCAPERRPEIPRLAFEAGGVAPDTGSAIARRPAGSRPKTA